MPWVETFVGFQRPFLEQLRRQRTSVGVRNDLIVVAVHDQDRHGDLLQIRGEVGLGEGNDAVVMRFRAAHHALTPPILDDRLRGFHARPVETVERPAGNVSIEY